MNIAIFTDAFYPQINGIVISIISLAENMIARGHNVCVLAPSAKGEVFEHPHIKVKRLRSVQAGYYEDFRWSAVRSRSTLNFLKDEKIDIMHFMTPVFASYLGIRLARKLKLPIVGTYHTLLSDPTYYKKLIKDPFHMDVSAVWRYTNHFYDQADIATAPSLYTKRMLSDNNCQAELRVISNGIDLQGIAETPVDSAAYKEKYKLGNKVILSLGRVSSEKNLETLLHAFSLVYAQDNEVQLLVVGDGPELAEFKAYAKSLNLAENAIVFTGSIAHEKLVSQGIFALASFFVTLSTTETQGITLLEAQANGLICLGANAGAIPDLLKDGENGFLVAHDDEDAIVKKIQMIFALSKEEKLRIKNRASELLKDHDIKHVMDTWENLYQDLVTRSQNNEIPVKKRVYLHQLVGLMIRYIYLRRPKKDNSNVDEFLASKVD